MGWSPGDQARALFTVARPTRRSIANATSDLSGVKKSHRSAQRPSRRTPTGRQRLADVAKTLTDQKAGRDRAAIFLVSDFRAGRSTPGQPIQTSIKSDGGGTTLGQAAKLFIARPMPSSQNMQIESLKPPRTMVLRAPSGSVVIPLEMSLRPFRR